MFHTEKRWSQLRTGLNIEWSS